MRQVVYVVPCFNEANRLDLRAFESLLGLAPCRLLFVDDGSTDDTRALLSGFAAANEGRVRVHSLDRNRGKGEAVRVGLSLAQREGAPFVGYADADLATPPEELARLATIALDSRADVVMGSRVARAGASIDRRAARHYIGRVFATYASLLLEARIYDTQCGAKVFRANARLERALASEFVSRWVFDVEILARLLHDAIAPLPLDRLLEVPLERWTDVGGSKIRATSVPRIALDILRATVAVKSRR